MISEKQYKISKRILTLSRIMLVLALLFLVWVGVDFIQGKDSTSDLVVAILYVAVFAILSSQHAKKVKQYLRQSSTKDIDTQ